MRRLPLLAVSSLMLLGACGSGQSAPAATPTAAPTVAGPLGTPAPQALSAFRCEEDGDDWVAAGFLSNDTKRPVTYQVTVYVGPADSTPREARTRLVPKVAPGGSTRFEIDDVTADGDACHVQVLAQ